MQRMKKTPNAEQVYNNLRADNEEWHSPALRLDACEGLVGKLHGSFVFRRCRRQETGAVEFWWNLMVSWWPPSGIWWSPFGIWCSPGGVPVVVVVVVVVVCIWCCPGRVPAASGAAEFFVEYGACFLKCGVRTETMTFGTAAGFHTGTDFSQVSERTSINLHLQHT